MDALDWTGNTDCNPAFNAALTKVEEMVTMEDQWTGLTEKFKLCSPLDGSNTNDVRSFLELLIDNLAGVVQYNGRYIQLLVSLTTFSFTVTASDIQWIWLKFVQ